MKKVTAILLLTAITFQVCSKLVVAGLFTINRTELVALFCINKQNPDSHCDGKCYLTKKLNETDSEPQAGSSLPVKQKTSIEEVWICEVHTSIIVPKGIEIRLSPAEPKPYLYSTTHTIFQPPRA